MASGGTTSWRPRTVITALVVGAVATFTGGIAQRTTGIGFSLIATPILVLALGPLDSVLIVNLCAALSASVVTAQVWRSIQWRRFVPLAIAGLALVPVGVLTAVSADRSVLQCAIGATILIALAVPLMLRRVPSRVESRAAPLIAGAVSGFMNAVAGVGGPALTAYAVVSGWDYAGFRATIQPIFVVMGLTSLTLKLVLGQAATHPPDPMLFAVFATCTVGGIMVGGRLVRILSIGLARALVIVIAAASAAAITLEAGVELLTR